MSTASTITLARPFAVLGVVLLCCVGCQQSDDYPSRPILLICPWAAGGGTDRISRQIAQQLERELHVPVNVVNATGGAGVTGHARGAMAPPDGYTLTTITPELVMFHWRGLATLSHRDFDPLMAISGDHAALFVRADSPIANLDDLVDAIRARRGTASPMKISGTSHLGTWHVAIGGWLDGMQMSPNDVIWVPLGGSAPSLQQLLAGGVEVVCCSAPEAYTLLEAGRIRCLATMSKEPLAKVDAPTVSQAVKPENRSTFTLYGWRGVAIPKGLPPARREKLLAALDRVISSQEYQDYLADTRFGYQRELPAEFARTLDDADATYGALLTSPAFRGVKKEYVGPYGFPTLLAGMLAVVAGGVWWSGGFTLREESGVPSAPLDSGVILRVAFLVTAVLAFVFLGDLLGFVVCWMLLLGSLLALLRAPWPLTISVALLLPPLVYHLFAIVLRVPLPWGILGW